MIYQAACRFFGRDATWDPSGLLPPPHIPVIRPQPDADPEEVVGEVVAAAYPILEDDARMRRLADMRPEDGAGYFDRMRKEYWLRREFEAFTVELTSAAREAGQILRKLGFKVVSKS